MIHLQNNRWLMFVHRTFSERFDCIWCSICSIKISPFNWKNKFRLSGFFKNTLCALMLIFEKKKILGGTVERQQIWKYTQQLQSIDENKNAGFWRWVLLNLCEPRHSTCEREKQQNQHIAWIWPKCKFVETAESKV